MLRALLEHPLTRGLDVDAPGTTALRRRLIREKPFLRRVYEEWYGLIAEALPGGTGPVLELGSGGGFLREVFPDAITSDVLTLPGLDVVLDGRSLPFADASLRAVVMTDVLHHVPDVEAFLRDAARAIRPRGAIVMIEPWVTPWSRLIYGHLHHEPFDPARSDWSLPERGPLSGANGALPWILFQRDRDAFARRLPQWSLERIRPFMPVRYLLSGGVSLRSLAPRWTFGLFRFLERLPGVENRFAMFALIVLTRRERPARRERTPAADSAPAVEP